MRPVKITDLPQADPLTGAELTIVVQNGVSKKSSVQEIVDNAASDVQHWADVAQSAAVTASGFANQANASAQAAAADAADADTDAAAALASANNAANSATVANNQAIIATNQAAASALSAAASAQYADDSAQSASDAADSADAAAASAGSASANATLAYEWAEKLDGPVVPGEYSAHYWANQAASAGGSTVKVFPAGESLGGQRIVVLRNGELYHADTTDSGDLGQVIGLTVSASLIGEDTQVQFLGDLTEPSWTWTAGDPVYFNASGVPTQAPPTSGFSQIVGFASTATKIYVQLREPIALG